MNTSEWIKKSNEGLKNKSSVYRIRNNLIYYFLLFYFVFTILLIILVGILFLKYISPYINLAIENKEIIIEFVNKTLENSG